jgi:hypothetical protein
VFDVSGGRATYSPVIYGKPAGLDPAGGATLNPRS